MIVEFKNVEFPCWTIGDKIDGITYDWADTQLKDDVIECVSSVCPDFIEFYKEDLMYTSNRKKKVLVALDEGNVVGTAIVNFSEARGLVGCITVKKEYYGKFVPNALVTMGNKMLRDAGIESSCIGYLATMNF